MRGFNGNAGLKPPKLISLIRGVQQPSEPPQLGQGENVSAGWLGIDPTKRCVNYVAELIAALSSISLATVTNYNQCTALNIPNDWLMLSQQYGVLFTN